jgi:hypothetical protein
MPDLVNKFYKSWRACDKATVTEISQKFLFSIGEITQQATPVMP